MSCCASARLVLLICASMLLHCGLALDDYDYETHQDQVSRRRAFIVRCCQHVTCTGDVKQGRTRTPAPTPRATVRQPARPINKNVFVVRIGPRPAPPRQVLIVNTPPPRPVLVIQRPQTSAPQQVVYLQFSTPRPVQVVLAITTPPPVLYRSNNILIDILLQLDVVRVVTVKTQVAATTILSKVTTVKAGTAASSAASVTSASTGGAAGSSSTQIASSAGSAATTASTKGAGTTVAVTTGADTTTAADAAATTDTTADAAATTVDAAAAPADTTVDAAAAPTAEATAAPVDAGGGEATADPFAESAGALKMAPFDREDLQDADEVKLTVKIAAKKGILAHNKTALEPNNYTTSTDVENDNDDIIEELLNNILLASNNSNKPVASDMIDLQQETNDTGNDLDLDIDTLFRFFLGPHYSANESESSNMMAESGAKNVESNVTGDATPNKVESSMTPVVSPKNNAETNMTADASTKNETNITAGVIPNNVESNETADVSPNNVEPSTNSSQDGDDGDDQAGVDSDPDDEAENSTLSVDPDSLFQPGTSSIAPPRAASTSKSLSGRTEISKNTSSTDPLMVFNFNINFNQTFDSVSKEEKNKTSKSPI